MGRIFSLTFSLFGVFVTTCVGAWWLNSVMIGLFLRRMERFEVVRSGPAAACVFVLLCVWVAFSVITVGVLTGLYFLVRAGVRHWPDVLPPTLHTPAHIAFVVCIGLAAGIGIFAALSAIICAIGAAGRRRFLFHPEGDAEPPIQDVDIPTHLGPGRRIVILCDGTSNRPDDNIEGESIATNIWKLSELLTNDETQTVWYQAGVGSDSSSTAARAKRTHARLAMAGFAQGAKVAAGGSMLIKLIESGFGVGISETVINGYRTIVHLYRPGDQIYLIGFSRGAFAARCIAGVISRCGLLRADYEQFAPDVVQIFRTRRDADLDEPLRLDMAYPGIGSKLAAQAKYPVGIKFLGVFDTVASLGFPLWGWWFRASPVWRNFPLSTDPAKVCENIYHALSMDEQRSQFFPTLFTMPTSGPAPGVLEQVWFRGGHADVGGGYARHDLSDIPLEWMMDAMSNNGLTFRQGIEKRLIPNPAAAPHDELVREPTWNYFGSWPRWHPVPGSDAGTQVSKLHTSVLQRADRIRKATGRADLLTITKREEFVVNTNVPWFRTGIIIEKGHYYRLTYLGGLTRDGGCAPCGPAGQKSGWDLRSISLLRPRLAKENWMTLAAAIAHPRIWTPQEKGLGRALYYLFVRAPRLLLRQIIVVGNELHNPNDFVYITNEAASGLLYFFVNDLWRSADNKSGGPRLSIELVTQSDEAGTLLTLTHGIAIDIKGKQDETNEWVKSKIAANTVFKPHMPVPRIRNAA